MRGNLSAALPAPQLQRWLLEDATKKRTAARKGQSVLKITIMRKRLGTDFWQNVSDRDAAFLAVRRAASLVQAGDQQDVVDDEGTLYRIMAF